MRKIIGYCWFSAKDTIGMVHVDNGFELKIYIGLSVNADEITDLKSIATFGAKVPYDEGLILMNAYGLNKSDIKLD